MNRFIDPAWEAILRDNGLDRFDALWDLPFETLDVPNRRGRRDSFSQVGRIDLKAAHGSTVRLVIKKQQNYTSRTLRHPLSGIPTFENELRNILAYRRKGIPVLTPVLLSVNRRGNVSRAVLLTEFLEGFVPLDRLIETRAAEGVPDRKMFYAIVRQTARIVRRIHDCGFQYGCLYPKHVFVNTGPGEMSIRLIDLENSRYRPMGSVRVTKDLETFFRHGGWRTSRNDRLRFLLAYTGEDRPDTVSRRICRRVGRRHRKKQGRTSNGS